MQLVSSVYDPLNNYDFIRYIGSFDSDRQKIASKKAYFELHTEISRERRI
jgi:hypothetical protein